MRELKCCPHCGCSASVHTKTENDMYPYKWKVKCCNYDCGCSTPWMDRECDAVDLWNRRTDGN